MSNKKIAVILIRGLVHLSPQVRQTLEYLRLKRKHACVVIDDTPVNRGMVFRVKDYVTYGVVDEAFFKEMLDKRAESTSKTKVDTAKIAKEYFEGKLKLKEFESKGIKPYIRLHPAKGGFERGGIKKPYSLGGVLGDRKDEIKALIVKML